MTTEFTELGEKALNYGPPIPLPDWMIVFEDAEVIPETFMREDIARLRLAVLAQGWNCHLFQRVESR